MEPKVAFITGANRGIGLETARRLGRAGVKVFLGCRDCAKGEAAASVLRDQGMAGAEALQFDVLRSDDHRYVAELLERFGRLDILVNNAAVSIIEGWRSNSASTVSEGALRATFDTNFFAAVAITQALLPLLKRSAAGRIVNVSSSLGSLTFNSDPASTVYRAKAFAYCASKTALNAFTVHLAAELRGTNVKVNSAHPGWVKTRMGGPAADLEPSEGSITIADLATLPEDGPTGGYFYLGQRLPW